MYDTMTTAPTIRKRPNILSRLFATLDHWYDRRATIKTLEGYSDHLLADIGLTRGTINQFVDGTYITTNRKQFPAHMIKAENESTATDLLRRTS